MQLKRQYSPGPAVLQFRFRGNISTGMTGLYRGMYRGCTEYAIYIGCTQRHVYRVCIYIGLVESTIQGHLHREYYIYKLYTGSCCGGIHLMLCVQLRTGALSFVCSCIQEH